jgi:lysozyme
VNYSPELVDFVKAWESCRLIPYLDVVNIWTCGYGHVLKPADPHEEWTQQYADAKLEEDLDTTGGFLQGYMTRDASQQQFDALLSLAFNCGVGAIGKSALMAMFNRGENDACADRFRLWDHAGGHEVHGLERRREAERAIFLNGDYGGRP